jgi:Protein of unknown function (DUF3489)
MEDHPMPKSNPEMRIADEAEPTERQQRSRAKKAGRITKAGPKRLARRKGAVANRTRTKPAIKKRTKQQTCIDLLSRQEGATIEELQAATGWQQHSVRRFLARPSKRSSASLSYRKSRTRVPADIAL